jgi:signal transduction histidine kinase/ligand-binding sensor domain-containing protein/DNA-binding response OmpR family regulator
MCKKFNPENMSTPNRYLLSLILIICSIGVNALPITTLRFEKFPYNDKLPSNSVKKIYNDKEGYMWFGTKDGLCRFDGYRTKIFRSSYINYKKLSSNNIQCIAEDNQNCLWIGTTEGIDILDKSDYTITPYNNSMVGRDVNDLFVDKTGNIWVATNSRGIIRIDQKKRSHIYQQNAKLGSIPSNRVSSIYQDSQGRIWVMFWKGGLALYQPNQDNFKTLPPIGNYNNPIRMLEDKNHNYWICTWGDGMFSMDLNSVSNSPFTPVSYIKNGKPFKVSNIIYSIVQDSKMGYLWIISFSGLDILEIKDSHTLNIQDSESMFNEPSNKLFHDIIVDRRGNLWLGSVGDGIYKLDYSKSSFQNNSLVSLTKRIGYSPNVYHACEVTNDRVYLVLDRLGLFTLDLRTNILSQSSNPPFQGIQNIQVIYHIKSKHEIWITKEEGNEIYIAQYKPNGSLYNIKSIIIDRANHSAVNNLLEDSHGNVWIGFNQGVYKRSADGKTSLINNKIANVTSIAEDTRGNIWVGTEKQGVFKIQLDINTKRFSRIINFSEKSGNLQSNSIQSVCCGREGGVYIGAREGSLYLYNEDANKMTDLSNKYGITEDAIQDIVEDNYGLLWISTVKKIIRYNPANHVSTYYAASDGVLVSSFSKSAGIRLQNGQIVFGGNKGLCIFSPVATNEQPTSVSKVTITNIDVNNQSIFDHNNESHFDSQHNKLILQPEDDNLSLEFSALNYSSAEKIQYAYRLIGIDKDWVYLGNDRRYVNYANLPAGRYRFEVKATNENGQWGNQISSLAIVKKAPFYQTWWAYLLYLAIIGGITYFILKNITHRIRLRNELKISHIEKEKSEELAQIKLRYFTNISHELLTPLTIIMLLIENLQKKNNGDSSQFEIMKDNIIRLKRLIQQILVFRKTESGNMKLKIRHNDVVAFVNNICQSNFRPLINEKEIDFSINVEHESYMAYFDPDKLDKVIYNLLSNAFKHTPKKGSIAVKMSFFPRQDNVFMRLSVSDTGNGIAEQDIPHIFKRFYISSTSDQSQSHGIGLALTYDLLQLHKGSIEVKSQLGEGAVFTFEIPVTMGCYTKEELWAEDDKPEETVSIPDIVSIGSTIEIQEEPEDKQDFTILVVEDNQELNNLIVNYFSNRYTVLNAKNGVQALEIVTKNEIDLVISDVMMPEMDGLTLCKILKNEVATSHIDVLMLTAKNSTEDRIDCYNAGADAYIAKPFEMAVLNARTRNLIQKRVQRTTDFKNNKNINISAMEYGSIDELFLSQAVLKVEEKLSDDTFDFDQFAIDMVTSKSTLYRKLKSLTDLSPVEFIRNIRLKHAANMLENNTGNIADIAFSVGFSDPKHFSKSFKIEFGLTPSEYQKSKKTQK